MRRATAVAIANSLRRFAGSRDGYRIVRLRSGRPLLSFHPWADGRALISADRITRSDGQRLILLLIDWTARGEFYYVVFPEDRSKPLAEIWQELARGGVSNLLWTYKPTKRDGCNHRRIAYFRRHIGDVRMSLAIPRAVADVPRFLDDTYALVEHRVKADTLDPEEPLGREEFPEGAAYEALHILRDPPTRRLESVSATCVLCSR